MQSITLTYDELAKSLRCGGVFAAGKSVPVALSPAHSGASVVTVRLGSADLAQDELTDGAGSVDLATDAVLALFRGAPLGMSVTAQIEVSSDDGLLGSGTVRICNTADAFDVLRVARAGRVSGILAEALEAGTPVLIDAAGELAGCAASDAAQYIGVLATGGNAGAAAQVVTAGAAQVPEWGLASGALYFLAHGSAALTVNPPTGYNVRPVGRALDASTLIMFDAPTVQSAAGGHYVTWSDAFRRFVCEAPASASSGAADSGKLAALGADGKFAAGFIPDVSGAPLAAVAAAFDGVAELDNPTVGELRERVNLILTTLQGL